jgi:hypothetical protein
MPEAGTPQNAPPDLPTAVQRLADPQQAVRDAAASYVRQTLAADAGASADPGEAFWKKKLASIRPGITAAQFKSATGATSEGTLSSTQSSTTTWRLDDYWTVSVTFDLPDKLRTVGPLGRRARSIWVEPPAKDFSGRWVTYFVNGVVDHDIQYLHGTYERFTANHDNGQVAYEQRYKDGRIDGPEVGFHRDGRRAYEIAHSAGKSAGHWVHWYPNGKVQSEQTYVDGDLDGPSIHWREDGTKSSRIDYRRGKETGQAAWDEQGKLLYARGTAEQAPDKNNEK